MRVQFTPGTSCVLLRLPISEPCTRAHQDQPRCEIPFQCCLHGVLRYLEKPTPSAPTNAYVTQVTLPITGALSFGYYFNTGKLASARDQNGADGYVHYLDPLDRQTHRYGPAVSGNRG